MWLKIKIWTKTILFGAVFLYAMLFMFNNRAQVTVWWWFGYEVQASMVLLVLFTFFAGVVVALLVRTTLTTIRQLRESRDKSRTARLEREVADMKSKAAMLQRVTPGVPGAGSSRSVTRSDGGPLDESL